MTSVKLLKLRHTKSGQLFETLFLVSPVFIMVIAIFNFVDTKWMLSRFIPIVSLYCLYFYRKTFIENIKDERLRPFLVSSLAIFTYFGYFHLTRGDEFGFSRTLITCIIYAVVVPWHKISREVIYRMLIIAGITCGLNACYEFFTMHISRVGIATNPIPYALYCASMSLSIIYIVATSRGFTRVFGVVGMIFASTALVLTDVRGIILLFPFVALVILLVILRGSIKGYLSAFAIIALTLSCSYLVFKDKIEHRIDFTISEMQIVLDGSRATSLGARLDLWQRGIEASKENVLFGIGDQKLRQEIAAIPNSVAQKQAHFHNQYVDTLVRYGTTGLLLLAIWIVSPLVSYRTETAFSLNFNPVILGIILITIGAGLTDVPFHHTHVVYLFSLFSISVIMTGRT
ncbi:O-antigen ligase family protein [Enterovibrio norvegicus]|uniref:O-antigen ligase family protein n=1 Tax=Enterovibrio norvegicus TaxID=188144 RepID=UPI003899B237